MLQLNLCRSADLKGISDCGLICLALSFDLLCKTPVLYAGRVERNIDEGRYWPSLEGQVLLYLKSGNVNWKQFFNQLMAILALPLRQWVILCLCSLYSTLLAHHKLHIRNFAAESFVFLMRKVSQMFVL